MDWIFCHMLALAIGGVLDLVVGDPPGRPHPVRLIGKLIAALERALRSDCGGRKRSPGKERLAGVWLCLATLVATGIAAGGATALAYSIAAPVGVATEAILTCWLLAARCLRDESMKVCDALTRGTLEDARAAVAMIVGRDVERLDRDGVARAAVETVAENASDGVIAPLFYAALGGPTLGFLYKAINTMDSMVGYRDERYEYFGWAAAKLDDLANYLPSRLTALLMILAAFGLGKDYSGIGALRIFRRDRYNHKSPNAGQPESVCAGALGLRLGGDSWYFGKLVAKPIIGDARRTIEPRDVPRALRLMFAAEALAFALALVALAATRAILLKT